jgi:phenylalanyl-tRNA synthetase beta chain
MILDQASTVGQSLADHLNRPEADVLYDLEITPNRADWTSLIGIAREISASTGNNLRLPEIHLPKPSNDKVDDLVAVEIENPDLCPRYAARIVRNIKIGPSPDWLRHALNQIGIRSINNVVDVTNYVMMETGQPLHAFDLSLLKDPAVIKIRTASEGEKFTPIDGQERSLSNKMLMITDGQKNIALAGIMGGENTEIGEGTTDVLIESACFESRSIRATSKQLELKTDASYRFERGSDVSITEWTGRRAAQLILETAGGSLVDGVVDCYPNPEPLRQISLRHQKVNDLLGIDIPPESNRNFLERLQLKIVGDDNPNALTVEIPTFRPDLKQEVDLIEEIVRLYGVDKIPGGNPICLAAENPFDAVFDELNKVRSLLAGMGLHEIQGQTLIMNEAAARIHQESELVHLSHPLSSDMDTLRSSLMPGLIDAVSHNARHRESAIRLFEIGTVFQTSDNGFEEKRNLAFALCGTSDPDFRAVKPDETYVDLFGLKGIVESFLTFYGCRGIFFDRSDDSDDLFSEYGVIRQGNLIIGRIGQLQPALSKDFDIRMPCFLAELDLDGLSGRRNTQKSFKPLPPYPSIRRDIAMLVSDSVQHQDILKSIRKSKVEWIESADIFDVYHGDNIPEGQKSVAYGLIYRSPKKTLTDDQVNGAHTKVIEALKRDLKATMR